jgi:hypothetical protein
MIQHARHEFDVRLEVVGALLSDLDTVTAAGRTFTMGKVIGLLQDELVAIGPALTDLQRRIVKAALEELTWEKGRQLPDSDTFVARTQMITHTLAMV